MAAVAFPMAPVANSAGVSSSAPPPPCMGDVYEDIADVVLLMTVFVIGWVLFNKLAVLFGVRTMRSRKAAPWSPAAAIPEPRKSCQEQMAEEELADAAGKGEIPLHPAAPVAASPTAATSDFDFDFDKLCTPTCGKAAETSATSLPSPESSLVEFDALFPSESFAEQAQGLSDDFAAEHSDSDAGSSVDHADDALVGAGLDAKIRDLAGRGNLSACWRAWRSAAASAPSPLCGPTCAVLAAAVRCGAASSADADLALEAAVSSVHVELAEAALVAGARLRDAAWLARACSRLGAAGVPFRPEHFAALARAYGCENRADLAADLWRDRCATLGLVVEGESTDVFEQPLPLPELYAAALEACVSSADFPSAWRLAAMSGWRAPASADGQAAMLALAKWLSKHQGVGVARRCIDGVRRAGGSPGPLALRALFGASARAGDMKQASELFGELVACNSSTPDFAMYSMMVRGFGSIGDVDGAMRYFREMRQRGLRPDTALFDAVISACAARNMLGLAEEVLADMEASGSRPTSATLAALVRLHAARGMPAVAAAVFKELPRRHGFEPDARAYHALISACLSMGRMDLAFEAFSTMSTNGCIPSAKTYEALATASLRSGDLFRAAALVEDALGLAPPAATESDEQQAAAAAGTGVRAAMLERRVLEELLSLAGRRREASSIGMPLLAKLQQAGVQICSRISEALAAAAAAEEEQRAGKGEELERRGGERRAAMDSWRQGFGRAPATEE